MPKLKVLNGDQCEEFELEEGEKIADCCEEAGLPFACTEGVCGTCVVEIVEGMLSDPTQEEYDFLGDDTGSERLACQCKMRSENVTVRY